MSHIKQLKDHRDEIQEALMNTDIVSMTGNSNGDRYLDVHFHNHSVPSIRVECDYDGSYSCYGGMYSKVVKWKDVKSAIASIKRKYKQIVEAEEREKRMEERKILREERETLMKEKATKKFGGRAKCISGLFGDNFSIRVQLDEDQVMKFIEHNKDFIDENGRWTI